MILLQGKEHDLGGGMLVRRVLPQRAKRTVGPFVFLDHMGPVTIQENQNTDVRPHPHIGLSTLTYLFKGRIQHRDSLGTLATIKPGEVNWMTAGSGISHSERSTDSDRKQKRELHGLQFWVALPDHLENCDPNFQHYTQDVIPQTKTQDYTLALIAGEGYGLKSPVAITSPLVFAEIKTQNDSEIDLPWKNFEIAIYVISGQVKAAEQNLVSMQMLIIEKNEISKIEVQKNSHIVIIGGEPIANPKHIWWNLVSSSKEKIEIVKTKWRTGTFPMVPGETDKMPLPE